MSVEFNPDTLLRHWFSDTRENPDAIEGRMDWWFTRDPARDRWLADAYMEDCLEAMQGHLACPLDDPHGRLAVILLTDQLPRNLFRGSSRAFESDAIALQLCVHGHRSGMDMVLSGIERVFFWMPLQHVEDLELQELGVELYDTLAAADPYRSALWKGFTSFARLHRDIIARFGRFPHRNEVLERESTPEELRYLEDGPSFGQ